MKNFYLQKLGERIKRFRKLKSLNQKDFAKMTKTSTSRLSEYENGNGCPNMEFLACILENFPDTDINKLLLGESAPRLKAVNETKVGYALDPRKQRMLQFMEAFFEASSADELVWLEMQLKFNIPHYRDFLESDDE